jgi:hypothetical protein
MLKSLTNIAEVQTADFYYRSTITPSIPTLVTTPPNILIPGKLGFYP